MTRRPGVTLVEVLVTLVIVGVGLVALLVLFPVGAQEMTQSVKDDRSGHAKHNAAAFASIVWPDSVRQGGLTCNLRSDPDVVAGMLNPNGATPNPYPAGAPLDPYPVGGTVPLNYYVTDPNGNITIDQAMRNRPSYPVIVDPNGYWANSPLDPTARYWNSWVGGGPRPNNPNNPGGFVLPRRVCCEPFKSTSPLMGNAASRRQQLLRWTALLDDIYFPRDVDYTGRPCQPPSGVVERTVRYSWAFMCRMPKAFTNAPVDLSVIVYSGRALEQAARGETAYAAVYNSGTSVISLSWGSGQDPPDVSIDTWIFDGTMTPDPHGFFYRVVGVNQTGSNSMDVEVQTPLRAGGPGVAIIMDGVVEAFDLRTF